MFNIYFCNTSIVKLPLTNGASLADDPHAKAFAQQLERVRPAPAVPEWERIAQEMQLFAARAAHEKTGIDATVHATVDATVHALDARVDSILAKRRWMLDQAARPAAG